MISPCFRGAVVAASVGCLLLSGCGNSSSSERTVAGQPNDVNEGPASRATDPADSDAEVGEFACADDSYAAYDLLYDPSSGGQPTAAAAVNAGTQVVADLDVSIPESIENSGRVEEQDQVYELYTSQRPDGDQIRASHQVVVRSRDTGVDLAQFLVHEVSFDGKPSASYHLSSFAICKAANDAGTFRSK